MAVDRELRADPGAAHGAADDRGPVQHGQGTESQQLRDRAWSSARNERERKRAGCD